MAQPDAVTFDASPVYLRSDIARQWLSRWLPSSRLIVLVRNPSQRAYSHWKMGREWMASKCTAAHELKTLRPVEPLLEFAALMERSLLQENWRMCVDAMRVSVQAGGRRSIGAAPQRFKYMALPEREREAARRFVEGRRAAGGGANEPFGQRAAAAGYVRPKRVRRHAPSSAADGEGKEAGALPAAAYDDDDGGDGGDGDGGDGEGADDSGDDGVARPLVGGPSGAPTFDCLREHDERLVAKFYEELIGDWPSAGETEGGLMCTCACGLGMWACAHGHGHAAVACAASHAHGMCMACSQVWRRRRGCSATAPR